MKYKVCGWQKSWEAIVPLDKINNIVGGLGYGIVFARVTTKGRHWQLVAKTRSDDWYLCVAETCWCVYDHASNGELDKGVFRAVHRQGTVTKTFARLDLDRIQDICSSSSMDEAKRKASRYAKLGVELFKVPEADGSRVGNIDDGRVGAFILPDGGGAVYCVWDENSFTGEKGTWLFGPDMEPIGMVEQSMTTPYMNTPRPFAAKALFLFNKDGYMDIRDFAACDNSKFRRFDFGFVDGDVCSVSTRSRMLGDEQVMDVYNDWFSFNFSDADTTTRLFLRYVDGEFRYVSAIRQPGIGYGRTFGVPLTLSIGGYALDDQGFVMDYELDID